LIIAVIKRGSSQPSGVEPAGPAGGNATDEWRVVDTWGDADRSACITSLECVPNGFWTDQGPEATFGTVLVGRKQGGLDVVQIDRSTGAVDAENALRLVDMAPSVGRADDSLSIASIHGLCMSEANTRICAIQKGGTVGVYDVRPGISQVYSFSCPPNVACSAYHAGSGQLAIGCQGAELKLYSVDEKNGALSYNGKGGKPDKVGVCDTPWNSAIAFNPSAEDGSQVIVGTGHGKLRLYDTKVGKRPQINVPFKDLRITCIAPDSDLRCWWVGDAGGNLHAYDIVAGKFAGAIKGLGGSVRSIGMHPTEPAIVSGGLDRYIRIHSTRSRSTVMKLYVTGQLTKVGFLGQLSPEEDNGGKKKSTKKRKHL
jgi:WD40 repeat protein